MKNSSKLTTILTRRITYWSHPDSSRHTNSGLHRTRLRPLISLSSSSSPSSTETSSQRTQHYSVENADSNGHGLYRLLTSQERQLLQEQRALTQLCREVASKVAIGASLSAHIGDKSSQYSSTSSSVSSYLKLQQMLDNNQQSNFLHPMGLESTFSVVIAGEFNAGKSTLINALVGMKLLETGALPTTDAITVVGRFPHQSSGYKYADDTFASGSAASSGTTPSTLTDSSDSVTISETTSDSTVPSSSSSSTTTPPSLSPSILPSMMGVIVHSVPDLPLLEDLTLIDTPGTNSAWIDHTERTTKLLPMADLILFVTSADRPFSDSERVLLQSIQAYRKSIVIVVNKMDILDVAGGDHGRDAKIEVVDFVTDKASELLGARPVVIPISARDALSVKLMERKYPESDNDTGSDDGMNNRSHKATNRTSGVWQRSNFTCLERFLKESLTTQAKLKSKLSNPIGVSEGILVECLKVLKEQRQELQVDISTLDILQSQFDGWKKELEADLRLSRTTISQMVREEGKRCHILINRLNPYQFTYWTLVDVEQLDREWEETKRAVSVHRTKDLRADVLEHVQETADLVATRGRAQGQAVIEFLGKRPAMKNQSLVGSVTAASRFEDTRKNLADRLTDAVEYYLKSDPRDVTDQTYVSRELRKIAVVSLILNIGTFGSGILLALQSVEPVSGSIMLGSFFVCSGATYIVGTTKVAQKYQQAWSDRATSIEQALVATAEKELDRVSTRILNGVTPYTRFIEGERDRIRELDEKCDRLLASAITLRNRINKLG